MNYQQIQREHTPITFDPADFAGMCRIMDTYGDSTAPFFGRNENGEDTCLSVCRDKITVRTHQYNGWVRINTYWRDGTREETFDGRWKHHEKSR